MTAKQPVNILMVDDQPATLLSYKTILAAPESTLPSSAPRKRERTSNGWGGEP